MTAQQYHNAANSDDQPVDKAAALFRAMLKRKLALPSSVTTWQEVPKDVLLLVAAQLSNECARQLFMICKAWQHELADSVKKAKISKLPLISLYQKLQSVSQVVSLNCCACSFNSMQDTFKLRGRKAEKSCEVDGGLCLISVVLQAQNCSNT